MYIYLIGLLSILICQVCGATSPSFSEPNGILSLGDVLALAAVHNPSMSAYSYEVRAKEAEAMQSGLWPNPELGVRTEEFGGSGDTRGFGGAETTIEISQLIELADKSEKRAGVARIDKNLADLDYKAKRLDVFTEAAKAYVEVLAAQERVALAEQLNKLAAEVKYAVDQKVLAGKVPPLEASKADIDASARQAEFDKSKRDLDIVRTKLAAFWGSINPQFAKLKGDIFQTKSHGTFEEFSAKAQANPDVARWKSEMSYRKAIVALEKSKTVPDVTLSAGTKYLAGPDDTAFVAGVSVPLPIFDRNQGNLSAARAQLNKTRELERQAKVALQMQLVDAYKSMLSACELAVNLRDKIVPAAQRAFDAANEGYREGKFAYLDLLDAQRTLFEAKQQYIDVLVTYHHAHANVARLAGGTMEF